jgi:putative DNA-binding protein
VEGRDGGHARLQISQSSILNHQGICMTKTNKVPKATITRLSIYYRQLELLEFDGYRMVSSEKLA